MAFDVVTHGIRELEVAFEDAKLKVDPITGKALRALAVPVQQSAQALAVANFSNIGAGSHSWSRMRIGRKRVGVYVAERQHASGGSPRPLFQPMMDRAMNPALEQHRASINAGTALVISQLCRETEAGMYRI